MGLGDPSYYIRGIRRNVDPGVHTFPMMPIPPLPQVRAAFSRLLSNDVFVDTVADALREAGLIAGPAAL